MFSRHLLGWYQRHKRDLPWRKTRDPYRIWISEIMLQQTTVNAVIPYYKRWLEIFPDVKALARARLQTVLKMWQGLGYYERARNLHTAAKIFVNKYEGKIPEEYEKLEKIPGFGPYTTAAVLSLAFHKPHPVLDANVRRVMMDPALNSGRQKWVRIKDLHKYPFPSGSAKIIQFLENMRE